MVIRWITLQLRKNVQDFCFKCILISTANALLLFYKCVYGCGHPIVSTFWPTHRPLAWVNGAEGRVVLCPMRNLMLFKRPGNHILPKNRVENAAHIYEDELFHHETGGHEQE